jgi:hypothetical protein
LATPETVLLSEVNMSKHPTGTASLYRTRQAAPKHYVNADSNMVCQPIYRGFRLTCPGSTIEAVMRQIDAWWADAYLRADTPIARELVLMSEQQQRIAPKDWSTAP